MASWAYTKHDKKHVKDNQKYVMCSGGVPKVSNVALQKRVNGNFRTTWTYAPNCISAIKADKYRVEYTVKYKALLGLLNLEKTEAFTTSTSTHTLDTSDDMSIDPANVISVEVQSIQISPRDKLIIFKGTDYYPVQQITNVKWEK